MDYVAPVDDIRFVLRHMAGLDDLRADGLADDLDDDLLTALLSEAGKAAEGLLAPLNASGDRAGATLTETGVKTAPGFADAYDAWREGGWSGVDASPDHGGMGLPTAVGAAVMELWNAANMAFALCPVLTQGAAEAIAAHGDEALKSLYLPRLVSGEWTAAMALTEPSAGSDLSNLRTRAEPVGDGRYRVFGTKIYITYGDHDLTPNIVHLVLARLPGAPAGTRGISLFLCPKFIPDADGSPGARNDFSCTGLEHKLGIHASPTCVMSYGDAGGAIGWLVGAENEGLAAMFTMMNRARLATGLQGVGIAEHATQRAYAYARERRQGRSGAGAFAPIIDHPDVARMLLDMRSMTFAARAIAYCTGIAIDRAHRDPDPGRRAAAAAREALLTPMAKAYGSDVGVDAASLGIQVHGGMGYIEETGAAQHLRDARIVPIYEGTNGIQAIDLVNRKVVRDGGEAARALIAEIGASIAPAASRPELAESFRKATAAIAALEDATRWLLEPARSDPERLAAAYPYLTLFSVTLGGGLLIRGALAARDGAADAPPDIAALALHYAISRVSHASALAEQVRLGSGPMADPAALSAYH
jgi:acyl-CoA dehydrogenase